MVNAQPTLGNRRSMAEVSSRCSFGKRMLALAAIAVVTFAAAPLFAATEEGAAAHPVYMRAGATGLFWSSSMTVHMAGSTIPGADSSMDPNFTLAVELGVFPFSGHGLLDDLAFSIALGIPPKASVAGAGSVATAGTLAKSTFGPAALTAHYHFRSVPYVQPYIGAGIAYAIVFGTDDAALKDASVDNAFGAVFQAGFDVPITARWGLYADAKFVLLSTTVRGTFASMPTSTDLTLNPLVISLGGTFRF